MDRAKTEFKTARKVDRLDKKTTPLGRAKAITGTTVAGPEAYDLGQYALEVAKGLGLYHKGGTKTSSKGKSKRK